jgi:hypothetical protein
MYELVDRRHMAGERGSFYVEKHAAVRVAGENDEVWQVADDESQTRMSKVWPEPLTHPEYLPAPVFVVMTNHLDDPQRDTVCWLAENMEVGTQSLIDFHSEGIEGVDYTIDDISEFAWWEISEQTQVWKAR